MVGFLSLIFKGSHLLCTFLFKLPVVCVLGPSVNAPEANKLNQTPFALTAQCVAEVTVQDLGDVPKKT